MKFQKGGIIEYSKKELDKLPVFIPPGNWFIFTKKQFASYQRIMGRTEEEIEILWKSLSTQDTN